MTTLNVSVNDALGLEFAKDALIQANVQAAADIWGTHLLGIGSIDIQVVVTNQLPNQTIALSGSLVAVPVGTHGGNTLYDLGAASEVKTGIDPNGSDPDIIVYLSASAVDSYLFLDPSPTQRTSFLPSSQGDAVSIFLHELTHGFAFSGFRNDDATLSVTAETGFDANVVGGPGSPQFVGAKAEAAYGGPVPLMLGNYGHYGNFSGPGADLSASLMFGVATSGRRFTLSALDLAIAADTGLPVSAANEYLVHNFGSVTTVSNAFGIDTVSFVLANSGINLNLVNNTASDGSGGSILFRGVENVTGSQFADLLVGDAAGNTLRAGGGNDTLFGDAGNNSLDGGGGTNTVLYGTAPSAVDVNLAASRTVNNGFGGNDTLTNIQVVIGSAFADSIEGSSPPSGDTLMGGLGNDTYWIVSWGSVVVENPGEGNDREISYVDTRTLSANIEGLILAGVSGVQSGFGNASDNSIYGNVFDNTLGGEDGNDTLTGDAGNDSLAGGAGNDSLNGGPGTDTADYALTSHSVNADLATGLASDDGFGNTDRLQNIEDILGSFFDDLLTGDTNNNQLIGGLGNDTLNGGGGDDTLDSGNGTNVLDGGAGIDTIVYTSNLFAGVTVDLAAGSTNTFAGLPGSTDTLANIENVSGTDFADQIAGDAGNNALFGNGGNDSLIGGGGNNSLSGGTGTDTVDYSAATGAVDVNLAGSQAANNGLGGNDTLVGFEVIIGTAFADSIESSTAGGDTLIGGGGNDTYWIVGPSVAIVENPGGGTDRVISYVPSLTLGDNVERLILSAAGGALNGTGNAQDNTIYGNIFANLMDGAGGSDTLLGDAGNDTLLGGAGDDKLVGGAGNNSLDGNTGSNTADYSAAPGTVDVNLSGSQAASNGFGGSDRLANIQSVVGSAFADSLENSATGGDTLAGGGGDDTYWIVGTSVTLVEAVGGGTDRVISYVPSVTLDTNVERLILSAAGGALNGTGNAQDNTVYGNVLNNLLDGAAGNDTLLGDAGNDTLIGGGGNNSLNGAAGIDTADYSAAPGAIDVNLSSSQAAQNGFGGSDVLAGMEVVIGSAFADSIESSGLGGDSLIGGFGNDTYWIVGPGVAVVESPGGGTDREISYVTNTTMGANVENLVLSAAGGARNGTGNAQDNTIYGNVLDNLLDGAGGNDTLRGAGGNDVYKFARSGGQDVIINGLPANASPTGELDIGAGVATDQIWLLQSGNDLQLELMGSSDRVTVAGWFSTGASQLNRITTADGSILDSQVNQLVQAMAIFQAGTPAFDPTFATQAPADPALQTALTAAWHH